MFDEKVICAGFGGQGVMSMGQLLAYAGMLDERFVSWMPSYGPEMRGGTAYCSVMVSDVPVGSPIVSQNASCAIVMNLPSLRKFEKKVAAGGVLLVNSSMTDEKSTRDDVDVRYVPANDLAKKCGSTKAANMVMLGAYLGLTKLASPDTIIEAFKKVFGEKAKKLIPLNIMAIRRGMEFVQESVTPSKLASTH